VTIGYLPVLYQLFAQRETFVIRLDARAGSPPSAASLLERHSGDEGLASLTTLLAQWEEWSASILESHLTYPMLAYYRSQHDNESWLAALTAVADACALLIVGVAPRGSGEIGVAAFQARMTFAGARLVLVEMGRTLAAGELREAVRTAARESGDVVAGAVREVVHDAGADAAVLASGDAEGDEPLAPPPARDGARRARPAADRHEFPDRLDAATFARLAECLGSSGYALPPDAPRALAELRATYEPYAVALGRYPRAHAAALDARRARHRQLGARRGRRRGAARVRGGGGAGVGRRSALGRRSEREARGERRGWSLAESRAASAALHLTRSLGARRPSAESTRSGRWRRAKTIAR
jgi:hypothetical protein